MFDDYDAGSKWVDTMQICKSGHVINDCYIKYPEDNQDYCEKCGEGTITVCENCHKPIPGRVHYTHVAIGRAAAPDYCRYCNRPYPWNKGLRKSKRGVKSVFGHLKRFIEWFAEVVQKLRKK